MSRNQNSIVFFNYVYQFITRYIWPYIEKFLKTGDAYELKDGGIIYKDKVCILLGSEVETSMCTCKSANTSYIAVPPHNYLSSILAWFNIFSSISVVNIAL